MRFFINPYPDYDPLNNVVDNDKIKSLIQNYVNKIIKNRTSNSNSSDLYVGNAGISYMFLKLYQFEPTRLLYPDALNHAKLFIDHAKQHLSQKEQDRAGFLCGNAGIFAVSSIISYESHNLKDFNHDKQNFLAGFSVAQKINYNKYGSDEILFGRAGYLSGIYFINSNVQHQKERISAEIISKICDVIIDSGEKFSEQNSLTIKLMFECFGDKYLGAGHGISAILHMLLESPMFEENLHQLNEKQQKIKSCIDILLGMQSEDGNFPCVLEDAGKSEHKLIHWCHGSPGIVYVLAKAYLIFKEDKYLQAIIKVGDLIWKKGLLTKGPGICHGIAGNGYVFLLLYRLTNDQKHIYRATCFANFLTNETFLREARTPDNVFSLYEGISGTICFLIDLLQKEKSSFPFMDVFYKKY